MRTARFSPEILPFHLTHCILVNSSNVIFWTNPFVISGALGLFCRFYFDFDRNSVDPDLTPHYVASDLGLHCLLMALLRVFT